MITGLHHIGIAVENLEEAVRLYRDKLGLRLDSIEEVPTERVRVAVLFAGSQRIELLQPTGDDSPIASFIAKRGVGIHHVAFESDDCGKEIKRLAAEDLRLLDETPRPGAHGTRCAFIHPKSLGSVLTEIVEDPQS